MSRPTNPELLTFFGALANPYRLQIIRILSDRSKHVSQLARDIGISRPLLIMHLKRLEEAGLVTSKLELSSSGKAMRFYQVEDFDIRITPDLIANAPQ